METTRPAVTPSSPQNVPPQALLDAGGEISEILLASIERYMDALAPGQILEVFSQHPDARADVPLWCLHAGHVLLHVDLRPDEFRFWIQRKGPA